MPRLRRGHCIIFFSIHFCAERKNELKRKLYRLISLLICAQRKMIVEKKIMRAHFIAHLRATQNDR